MRKFRHPIYKGRKNYAVASEPGLFTCCHHWWRISADGRPGAALPTFFCFLLMPLEKAIYTRIRSKFVSVVSTILIVTAAIGGLMFLFGNQLAYIVGDMASIQDQLKAGLQQFLTFIDENIPYVDVPADQ